MIREFGETIGDAVLRRVGRAYGRVQERTPLEADVLESDEEYLLVVDAPGAVASDVQVKYADDRVLVRIDRFREFHEGFEMRFPGRGLALDSEVELPADAAVDPDRAAATLTDRGTLEIRVPKDRRSVTGGSDDATQSVEETDGGAEEEESDDDSGERDADDGIDEDAIDVEDYSGDETDPGDLEDDESVTDETDDFSSADDEDADDA